MLMEVADKAVKDTILMVLTLANTGTLAEPAPTLLVFLLARSSLLALPWYCLHIMKQMQNCYSAIVVTFTNNHTMLWHLLQ